MGSALLCAGSDGDGEGARGEVEGPQGGAARLRVWYLCSHRGARYAPSLVFTIARWTRAPGDDTTRSTRLGTIRPTADTGVTVLESDTPPNPSSDARIAHSAIRAVHQ